MTDRTPLFQQCISIVEASGLPPELSRSIDNTKFHVKDTFIHECLEIKLVLANLNTFINEIRLSYLEAYDRSRNVKSALTIEDKDKIDEDFQFKVQEILQKLKFLQDYERKRQETHGSTHVNGVFSFFKAQEEEDLDLFWTTIAAHRNLILKSLNLLTNKTSKKFDLIQKKRAAREKQISKLNFEVLDDDLNLTLDEDILLDPWQQHTDPDFVAGGPGDGGSQLTQIQLQQLDAENQEFLTLKTNELAKVEKLRSSMADIVNMLQELSFQLETQAEKLDSLLDNQDQVDLDIRQGNRSLTKATSRNKAGTNIIVTLSIVAAFLLLFLDYIS